MSLPKQEIKRYRPAVARGLKTRARFIPPGVVPPLAWPVPSRLSLNPFVPSLVEGRGHRA